MQSNFYDYNQIPKRQNETITNNRSNNSKFNPIPKRQIEEENNIIMKKPKRFEENNPNKRYLTPLALRYQIQSNDNTPIHNYSRLTNDKNDISNKNKMNNENDSSNNNDVFYYKNLYQQTKNNLNKEKQKNEENQIINDNLNKENNLLNNKIKNLTSQLDRLINLVELSNSQNIKNMSIKQDQINKLTNQIELLKKTTP